MSEPSVSSAGLYPERAIPFRSELGRWLDDQAGRLLNPLRPLRQRLREGVNQAEALEPWARRLDDGALRRQLARAALRVWRAGETLDRVGADGLAQGLALVREAAWRSLGLRPFDTQLLGAASLNAGRLAEMQTGEGKTLTAGLAAALAASAHQPVHVVTVNDYLARRDAEELQPLFGFLGLSVGSVLSGMDLEQRAQAYRRDICYCTGKELVFDYLKDRAAQGPATNAARLQLRAALGAAPARPLLLRGLHFAIVDEADSILIDEARTPLILSENAGPPEQPEQYAQALELAGRMHAGRHYRLDRPRRLVELNAAGRQWLTEQTGQLGGGWAARAQREHLAAQALRALHLFRAEQQYILKDGKVQIVDEHTGRVLAGRTWEQGLHQMIECKEGVALSDQARTVARITYQRFFRRYLRLAGMTGTAREVSAELWSAYGLDTVIISTHKPCQRRLLKPRCMRSEAEKWREVARIARALRDEGRALLVGTRSVEASERLARCLAEQEIPHRLLNARQDAEEAALVKSAGQSGMVTIATNMAGRGTDIKLDEALRERGGLHVILTEFHDSSRVDRQLFGRAARQGDPGSAQALVSLEDELLRLQGGALLNWLSRRGGPELHPALLNLLKLLCQYRTEARHRMSRREATRQDERLASSLAFTGHF